MDFAKVFSILILFGAILMGFWYFNTKGDIALAQQLQKEGVQTSAKVEDIKNYRKTRRLKKKYKSVLKIAFKAQQDSVHTTVGISWSDAWKYNTGTLATVYYLPKDPEAVMLSDKVENPSGLWTNTLHPNLFWFGIMFWGLAALAWRFRNRVNTVLKPKEKST